MAHPKKAKKHKVAKIKAHKVKLTKRHLIKIKGQRTGKGQWDKIMSPHAAKAKRQSTKLRNIRKH